MKQTSNISLKNKILWALGYIVLSVNILAVNHIPQSNEIALGKKIYQERCKVCHGDKGDGQTFAANALFPPPKNFISKKNKLELTLKQIIRSVTLGLPNTAMMPWKNVLSPREIQSVANYIRNDLMELPD